MKEKPVRIPPEESSDEPKVGTPAKLTKPETLKNNRKLSFSCCGFIFLSFSQSTRESRKKENKAISEQEESKAKEGKKYR